MGLVENMNTGLPVQRVSKQGTGHVHLAGPACRLEEHRTATFCAERTPGTGTRLVPGRLLGIRLQGELFTRKSGPRDERRAVSAATAGAMTMGDPLGGQVCPEPDGATETGTTSDVCVHGCFPR